MKLIVVRGLMALVFLSGVVFTRGFTAAGQDATPGATTPCPEPPAAVSQAGQLDGLTMRFGIIAGTEITAATSVPAPTGLILEAGRICIEPGAAIPDAEALIGDGGNPGFVDSDGVRYLMYRQPATIYVERGQLEIRRHDDAAGTVLALQIPSLGGFKDTVAVNIAAGASVMLNPGDVLLLQGAYLFIRNTSATDPAVILSTGINVKTDSPPGCAGINCWIPS